LAFPWILGDVDSLNRALSEQFAASIEDTRHKESLVHITFSYFLDSFPSLADTLALSRAKGKRDKTSDVPPIILVDANTTNSMSE
jgi:hypothetical protein